MEPHKGECLQDCQEARHITVQPLQGNQTKGETMIDDLRHLPKQDDSFQIIPPDLAVLLLVFGVILGYVLGAVS